MPLLLPITDGQTIRRLGDLLVLQREVGSKLDEMRDPLATERADNPSMAFHGGRSRFNGMNPDKLRRRHLPAQICAPGSA